MDDQHANVLTSLLEAALFRLVYSDVTIRNLVKSTKKKYISKSSFETNLEDAKYMTQTSFLILSKWENLVNVVALLFDIDLKNVSLKKIYGTKNLGDEIASLFHVKKSLSRFQKIGRMLWGVTTTALSTAQNQGWIFTKIAVIYWTWFFVRSLTWNRIILGLLLSLAKQNFFSEKVQVNSVTDFLLTYIHFFTTGHLLPFFSLFQSVQVTKNFPNLARELNQNLEQGQKMSENLLSKLKEIMQFEWTKRITFLTGYVMPAAVAYLINFWSSTLSMVMPVTMALLGEQKGLKLLSKL